LRSRPCGERWHEHLRGRRPVADRGMRANHIVVPSPTLDDDLGFARRIEDLAIEKLVAQARVEALHKAAGVNQPHQNILCLNQRAGMLGDEMP